MEATSLLLEAGVFEAGFGQGGEVGVCPIPEGKELVVGLPGSGVVTQ